jgi:hypothetical protein
MQSRFERRDEGNNCFNGQIRISIILLMAAVVISVIVTHLRLWKSTEVLRHTILLLLLLCVSFVQVVYSYVPETELVSGV